MTLKLKHKLESLALGIALSATMSSCGSSDNASKPEESQPVKTEQQIQQEKTKQMQAYSKHIMDSVKAVNNYDSLYNELFYHFLIIFPGILWHNITTYE